MLARRLGALPYWEIAGGAAKMGHFIRKNPLDGCHFSVENLNGSHIMHKSPSDGDNFNKFPGNGCLSVPHMDSVILSSAGPRFPHQKEDTNAKIIRHNISVPCGWVSIGKNCSLWMGQISKGVPIHPRTNITKVHSPWGST